MECEIYVSTAKTEPQTGSSVVEQIRKCAVKTPDALAVASKEKRFSYLELFQSSSRIAAEMASAGVGPEVLVGILLDRSPEAVAANLGVLQAGGAYLPLDPLLPAERLAFLIHNSGVRHFITNSVLLPSLSRENSHILDIDTALRGKPSEIATVVTVPSDSLAYVVYTSGSTGEPKGVEVTHAGLFNLVSWHLRNFNINPSDRASHLAACSFDAAVWEVWPYLCAGASVHIPDPSIRSSPIQLRDWIVAERLSVSFLPTAIAEQVMELDWPNSTKLRILLTGAETLNQRPRAGLPFVVVNNYGPTECSVVATSGVVRSDAVERGRPSIGLPIDGIDLRILDPEMREMPPGEVGEIFLGGVGLARGYRNRSDLTAQSFVLIPSKGKTERFYRTGDLGRIRPDGEVDFGGRTDEQFKIRGHRVELNEVLRALHTHPDVASAAVAARGGRGETSIFAYIVVRPGHTIDLRTLLDHMRRFLPDYMLPAGFIRIDQLPLSPNGKIDRAALPEPSSENVIRESFTSPTTIIEERVAAILAKLLHVDKVGRSDNFFLLGGHSLLATQLITHLDNAFGVQITLLSLFDHPTVAGIAQQIEDAIFIKLDRDSQPSAPAGNVVPVGRTL